MIRFFDGFMIIAGVLITNGQACSDESMKKCMVITVSMCRGIGYNMTSMPNQFNHKTQEEAELEVYQFWPLVELDCSSDLKFYLCSVFTPICIPDYPKPLPACRSVCERARNGCEHLMGQYGFDWPSDLDCTKLPLYGQPDQLCMDHNDTSTATVTQVNKVTKLPQHLNKTAATKNNDGKFTNFNNGSKAAICNSTHSFCESNLDNAHCKKATFWRGFWSTLCCLLTFFTILSFLLDRQRFKYPERPIIFISFCYFFVSMGYIVHVISGCTSMLIETSDNGFTQHLVVSITIYFFSVSSLVWWLVFAFTWFLTVNLNWNDKSVIRFSHYFHIISWAVPSVYSVIVLVSRVGGYTYDRCNAVADQVNILSALVIDPLLASMVLGSFFTFSVFISMVCIHKIIDENKGPKLTVIIVIVSIIYILFASVILVLSHSMHLKVIDEKLWTIAFSMFLSKYFLSLIVTISTCFRIWPRLSMKSWHIYFCNIFYHSKALYMPSRSPTETTTTSVQIPLNGV